MEYIESIVNVFAQNMFLLATYGLEVKYWFRVEKMKIFTADFHVLGLFMAKKHDLSKKKSVCHVPLPLPLQKFVSTLAQSL
jgi:hypothetical protein